MNWDGLRDLCEHATLEAANAGAKTSKDWGHPRKKLGSAIPTSSLCELLGVGKQKCHEKTPQGPLSTYVHPCASSPAERSQCKPCIIEPMMRSQCSCPSRFLLPSQSQMNSPCHSLGRFSSVVKLGLWLGFLHMSIICRCFDPEVCWNVWCSPKSAEHTYKKQILHFQHCCWVVLQWQKALWTEIP